MKSVLTWIFIAGLIWFAAVAGLTGVLAAGGPSPNPALAELLAKLMEWGPGLGQFAAGPLSLALVFYILLAMAERLGFRLPSGLSQTLTGFDLGINVQSLMALIIVGSFCVAALSRVGSVGDLKDIALVVVGFYFGQRKRTDELQDAATTAAASAAGAAVAVQQGAAAQSPPANT